MPKSLLMAGLNRLLFFTGLSVVALAAEPPLKPPDSLLGGPYTVTATVASAQARASASLGQPPDGVFTIPRGYAASQFSYQWHDPATSLRSNRLAATTVYSLSRARYMTELKNKPAAVLPAGTYQLMVGGTPGASAELTYTLEYAEPVDESEQATLKRLWFAVVDFRNECVRQGEHGWRQFADPLVLQHLSQIDRQIWKEQADAGWSYFFSLAMFDLGRPTSDAPVVGFYHPWSDVWLFTEWKLNPVAKIVGIELLSGEYVRQRGKLPIDLRVDWLDRDGFRVEQLARSIVDNLSVFQSVAYSQASWRDALQLTDRTFEAQEFNDWVVTLQLSRAWLRAAEAALGSAAFDDRQPMPPALGRLIPSYRRFLTAAKAGELNTMLDGATRTNPSTAESLRRLPRETFGRFQPVYWLADDHAAQAYLALDRNPDFCLVLTYEQVGGDLQLDRVDLVHFPTAAKVMQREGRE